MARLPSLSLDQLNAFVDSGKGGASAPPPPAAAPQPAPKAQAPPQLVWDGTYPEVRVVTGIASLHELAIVIARSARRYGGMTKTGNAYTIQTYKHVYEVTALGATRDGKPVVFYDRIYDAVRILRGEVLPIDRNTFTTLDYAVRRCCEGFFAPADMPTKPTPIDA